MSWLTDIFSGSGQGILKGIGDAAKGIREAITGEAILDPNKSAEIKLKLVEIESKISEFTYLLMKGQIEINLEEAKNPNLFVSGWRPFIGWTCGFSLWWQFIFSPIFEWVVKLMGKNIVSPVLDTTSLLTILMAMLGLGGMRTFEKYKGTQNNH